jgi:hypothetical protein
MARQRGGFPVFGAAGLWTSRTRQDPHLFGVGMTTPNRCGSRSRVGAGVSITEQRRGVRHASDGGGRVDQRATAAAVSISERRRRACRSRSGRPRGVASPIVWVRAWRGRAFRANGGACHAGLPRPSPRTTSGRASRHQYAATGRGDPRSAGRASRPPGEKPCSPAEC